MFDISKQMPGRDDELAEVCTNSRLKARSASARGRR